MITDIPLGTQLAENPSTRWPLTELEAYYEDLLTWSGDQPPGSVTTREGARQRREAVSIIRAVNRLEQGADPASEHARALVTFKRRVGQEVFGLTSATAQEAWPL